MCVQEANSSEDESLASEGSEGEEPDSEAMSDEEEGMDWDELEEEAMRCVYVCVLVCFVWW